MSNKTSDKNVGNVTKSDIDVLKALIYVYEARLPNYNELMDSEVKALKNILAELEQDKKQINTSLGFSIGLERILNHLVKDETYMAMISNIKIRYIGEKEDTANGKRQVFEIERQVD